MSEYRGKCYQPQKSLPRRALEIFIGKITMVKYPGIIRGNWWFIGYREK